MHTRPISKQQQRQNNPSKEENEPLSGKVGQYLSEVQGQILLLKEFKDCGTTENCPKTSNTQEFGAVVERIKHFLSKHENLSLGP